MEPDVVLADLADVVGVKHDQRKRPFAPFDVLDRDDGRSPDARFLHDDVLELDRRNPLAAALESGRARRQFVSKNSGAAARPGVRTGSIEFTLTMPVGERPLFAQLRRSDRT